jgi:hypothetical protein
MAIGDAFILIGIDLVILLSRFLVVNVLGFVCDKSDSMLGPKLFDLFGFLIFLGRS